MAYPLVAVEVWDTIEGFPNLSAHVRLTHFPDFETFARVIDLTAIQEDEIREAHEQVQINVYVRDESHPDGRRRLSLGRSGDWLPAFKSDALKLYAYEQEAIDNEWKTIAEDMFALRKLDD